VEDLLGELDVFMGLLQDVSDFRVVLAQTRQTEPLAVSARGDASHPEWLGAFHRVSTAQVVTMDQPLGETATALFHLNSSYRSADRLNGEHHQALLLVLGTFTVFHPAVGAMDRVWVCARALHWFLHAKVEPHILDLTQGASSAAIMRIVSNMRASVLEQEVSLKANLCFYVREGGDYFTLANMLLDDHNRLTTPESLLLKLRAGVLDKERAATLPLSAELLSGLEQCLLDIDFSCKQSRGEKMKDSSEGYAPPSPSVPGELTRYLPSPPPSIGLRHKSSPLHRVEAQVLPPPSG
jgi:hypothetical protein